MENGLEKIILVEVVKDLPRIKKKVKIQAEIAAQEAKKEVYQEVKTKKKRVKILGEKTASGLLLTSWIEDPLDEQNKAFFDGYKYWLTTLLPREKGENEEINKKVAATKETPEQWEERNKEKEKNKNG